MKVSSCCVLCFNCGGTSTWVRGTRAKGQRLVSTTTSEQPREPVALEVVSPPPVFAAHLPSARKGFRDGSAAEPGAQRTVLIGQNVSGRRR